MREQINGAAAAIEVLRKGKTFWVASHLLVDGDGLGSLLAMTLTIRKSGKTAYPVNQGPLPRNLSFLPGIQLVATERPTAVPDAVITLDTPSTKRLGIVGEWLPEGVPIINLDHHISNERFGTVNVVEPDLSSTGEVVYLLLREGGFELDPDIATNLFTAICTDTGRFSYSNTSADTLEIAAHLVRIGARLRQVSRSIYESRTRGELELQARVLAHLATAADGRIAWSFISRADVADASSHPLDGLDLIDVPRSLKGVAIAIFFREDESGLIRISLRSDGEIDVAAFAAALGGGGHRNSAGCTIEGPLEGAIDRVVEAAREALDGRG